MQRYSADVFVTFSQLLTEMVLRLPYQVKKVLSAVPGSNVVLFGEVRARPSLFKWLMIDDTLSRLCRVCWLRGAVTVLCACLPQEWRQTLCEYMMAPLAPFVRRQVRKLLLYICGTKDTYRQLRDLHALEVHIKVHTRPALPQVPCGVSSCERSTFDH